jgi:hypothetical protein
MVSVGRPLLCLPRPAAILTSDRGDETPAEPGASKARMGGSTVMKQATLTTLLDLVRAVQDVARSDREVVAVVTYLVNSGQVVLAGNFAGRKIG